jgi:beta-mannosidase
MHRVALASGWTLSRTETPSTAPALPSAIDATVPGCVHLDLLEAGLIADPYLDVNEITQDWIGRSDWQYRITFEAASAEAEAIDLVCLGLDTAATLTLNGHTLGTTRNMNRSYRFPMTKLLREGENVLTIDIQSAYAHGEVVRLELGDAAEIPANYPGPGHLIRKMACNFGWDWGPTLVTAGAYRPVLMERWSGVRLASVRPQITVEGRTGRVRVDVDLEWHAPVASDMGAHIVISIDGATHAVPLAEGQGSATLFLEVKDPQLWWPHGLGEPALYDLSVTLRKQDGTPFDVWERRVGFRSIRLDTTPDAIGSAFTLVVNDVPVFVRGANWIPDDCFLPRVTPERYRARIAQARDANMNLLRVWGGGIYETDDFYDACNEAGLMVWQDFLFACAAYPEEEPVRSEVEAEAREAIVRLMPHPALVLWNGNNENIWGYFDWGWQAVLGDRAWGNGYYLDLLPKLVETLDPTRPYWAGSPYSGSMDIPPNADEHGCKHIWDVWNDVGYEVYRDYVPRFCSEFGWQAPPTLATLRAAVRDAEPQPGSPGILHHQKATLGNDRLLRGLEGWFPKPETFMDWHFVTQLNQARAITVGVEHMRSHAPVCMGAIVWQLNDCWPVTSWSAIDGYGRRKPLWYALRKSYAPHLVTIQPRSEGLAVVAVNDTTLFWRVPFSVERLDFDGNVLARHAVWRVLCDRLETLTLPIPSEVATPADPSRELLRARIGQSEALYFFEKDLALAYPPPRFELSTTSFLQDGMRGTDVMIEARALLRDVCLLVDQLDPHAEVDDMLMTLLPGEKATIRVSHDADLSPSDIAGAIRSASDLFHPKS